LRKPLHTAAQGENRSVARGGLLRVETKRGSYIALGAGIGAAIDLALVALLVWNNRKGMGYGSGGAFTYGD
jgi:hypothetical protein